jgi:4-amino-4-deoxy-L-arabinose transferase-like glycosyltransferase
VSATSTQPQRVGDDGQKIPGRRAARLLRGRRDDPAWARPALVALLAGTSLLYLVGLSRNGWANDFYAAAVQAGATSWKAFLFGSFDSASFITVDKTPASLWIMELSARVFGVNYWSLLVPQALEGVATVGVLYAAVRRWFGPSAALIAGAVMALTPVATLMFRYNNPDSLLVLVMVVAAYTTTRALESGKTRWLALTGALLGLGFLTKMLQAFLVLPVFALVYLVAGPPGLGRRIWQLLAGGAALLVSAGWWVAIVMLTPAADRPYIGGSTDNSILQLTFGYNGLGRLDGNEAGSVGFGNGGGPRFGGSASLTRLFGPDMGGQISWLIPAALIALAALLWVSRRAPRMDRTRSAALLWGGWLTATGLVFSYMSGIIHPYYTVALAPAVGALTGIGATALWRDRRSVFARMALVAMLAVTAGWAWVLLGRSPGWYPWLRVVILAAALGAAAVILIPRRQLTALSAGGRGRMLLVAAPLSLAMVAGLGGPLAYSIDTAATAHTGALPSAGPAVTAGFGPGGFGRGRFGPNGFGGLGNRFRGVAGGGSRGTAGTGGGAAGPGGSGAGAAGQGGSSGGSFGGQAGTGQFPGGSGSGQAGTGRFPGGSGGRGFGGRGFPGGGLGGNTQVSSALTRLLETGAAGYTWTAATVGSESAAPLQLATGQPVLAIGGFNGTDPAPSLAEFEKLVAEHKIHYFVGQNQASFGGGSGDASRITSWVESHFTGETVGGVTVFNLAGHAAASLTRSGPAG